MSEQNPLFRKAALDKLSSPERLDVLMQVTSPKSWLALLTVLGLLVAVIAWSILGTIPDRLDGQGVLMRGGALRDIRSPGEGVVDDLALELGMSVQPGMSVGTLRNVRNETEGLVSQDTCARERTNASAVRVEQQGIQMGLRAQIQSVNDQVESTRLQLAKAQEELKLRQDQLARGLGTRQQVLAAEKEIEGQRSRIATLEGQGRQFQAQIAQADGLIRGAEMRAGQACARADAGTRVEEALAQITSEVAGRVIELRVRKGDQVRPGTVLAVIEPEDATLEAVMYFDARTAKQIQLGREAQLSPTNVKREEYGFIRGEVTFIGEGPVTIEKMTQDLANQALAQELYNNQAKIEVRAKPKLSDNTPSGFQWSSSVGPDFKIEGITRVNSSVVVQERAPYTLVIPMIRRTLGAS